MTKVLDYNSARKKAEVQTWQETVQPCEHTLSLHQDPVSAFAAARSALKKCQECEMGDNLWLCMGCGYVGCGRRQFDGSGGNGHAAKHAQSQGHVVSLKLGTISPEGSADIFCYTCDEMRSDPHLSQHLALFDIHVEQAERTTKSMAELQLEQNMKWSFSMATEDGREYAPAGGLGLVNLGNSCYLASVMQVCCGLAAFKQAFSDKSHFIQCSRDPGTCLLCQLTKLQLQFNQDTSKQAVAPWMFKAAISSGHADFASAQQQDAAEFLAYLLKVIQRNDAASPSAETFSLGMQQRISCTCGAERIQSESSQALQLELAPCIFAAEDPLDPHISLEKCIQLSFQPDIIDIKCSECQAASMSKELYMTKLPRVLALPLSRYVVENWVPKKLDLPIAVPPTIDLSPYVRPARPDTKSTPTEESSVIPADVDEMVLQQLMSMGFAQPKCVKALQATGNAGPEMAMNWLFEHMDDPVDELNPNEVPADLMDVLVSAGFSPEASKAALLATDMDVERAFDYILSHQDGTPAAASTVDNEDLLNTMYDLTAFISHKGPSIHCGHYVAYRKHPSHGRWILCNDDRLALVPDEEALLLAASTAYIFFYTRRSN